MPRQKKVLTVDETVEKIHLLVFGLADKARAWENMVNFAKHGTVYPMLGAATPAVKPPRKKMVEEKEPNPIVVDSLHR